MQVCQLHNVSDVTHVVEQTRPKVNLAGFGSLQVHPVLVVSDCRLLNKLNQSLWGKIFKSLSDGDETIELSSAGENFSMLDLIAKNNHSVKLLVS